MTHFSHAHVYTHTQTLMIFFLVILKICLREGELMGGGAEAENLQVDSLLSVEPKVGLSLMTDL